MVLGLTITSGCGPDQSAALDTLPPMSTTTSTTTTTVPPDERRKFYTVKSGDTVSEIARALNVPARAIIDMNDLPDGGRRINAGQILEVPVDVVMIYDLPATCNDAAG